jgi:hypothetical protein
VLQVDALLVTRSSWSGLLYDHADDARAFRTASIGSRHPLFTRTAWNGSNVLELSRSGFFESRDWDLSPRTSALLLAASHTLARLV